MLIDKKRLMKNYTLKPVWPSNISELDTQEVYKQWLSYAMVGVNKYVELLHKQLIRKKKASTKDVFHPLFNNSYIVNSYNIKSSSTAPYNRENYNDLGLNQLFVGQDPYKPYQGDPNSKNGIYHDNCMITPINTLKNMSYNPYSFPKNLILLFEKKQALKYNGKGFYYIDEKINFKNILNKALENVKYEKIINEIDVVILAQTILKNNEWMYPNINDIKIPDIKVKKDKLDKKLYVDVLEFYNDLKDLNKSIFRIERVETTLFYKDTFFTEAFNSIKEKYKCEYATPLCFYNSFDFVCYEEPYIATFYSNNIINENANAEFTIYPLYQKGSNSPYGRSDRWLSLWDNFYKLYVSENNDLEPFIPLITIVAAVATWYIGGQGAWLAAGLGVSSSAIAGITLAISLTLAIGSLTGNKLFSTLNAIWGLVNFIGMLGANNWNLAADFAKNAPVAAQEITAFEATLNVIGNLTTGATLTYNVVKSITEKSPNMLNASDDNTEDLGNGGEALELAKDIINPTIWYNFETADILNEVSKKEKTLFLSFKNLLT